MSAPHDRPARAMSAPHGSPVRKAFSSPLASVFVIAVTVLWTIPTVGLLVTSLRPKQDVTANGWWNAFLHPDLGLGNYHTVLFEGGSGVSTGLMPFLVNSLAISVPATLFPLVLAAMAAYGLAWVRFRGATRCSSGCSRSRWCRSRWR